MSEPTLSKDTLSILRPMIASAWQNARALVEDPEADPELVKLRQAYWDVDRALNHLIDQERYLAYGAYCEIETYLRGKQIDIIGQCQQVTCIHCGSGYLVGIYETMPEAAAVLLRANKCRGCGDEIEERTNTIGLGCIRLCSIHDCYEPAQARTSLDLYAGYYCDKHYETAFPFRKEGKEGYSWFDAGEAYE